MIDSNILTICGDMVIGRLLVTSDELEDLNEESEICAFNGVGLETFCMVDGRGYVSQLQEMYSIVRTLLLLFTGSRCIKVRNIEV
ncbi:hypothetical protein QTP88_012786 [Uroleucon formosanum]